MPRIDEDVVTGDVFMRNMRTVLAEEGFTGEGLENKIKELMQKDANRIAAVILAPRAGQGRIVRVDDYLTDCQDLTSVVTSQTVIEASKGRFQVMRPVAAGVGAR